jgi:hypothetical protein
VLFRIQTRLNATWYKTAVVALLKIDAFLFGIGINCSETAAKKL